MNVLNDKMDMNFVSKVETELVQLQQKEYYLIGRFLRTPGLTLYYYDHNKDEIIPASIVYRNTANLDVIDGKLVHSDCSYMQCSVDMRFVYFESLNFKTAHKRLAKYKSGQINELCNLKKANEEGIKFY